MRIKQEEIATALKDGYYKTIIKFQGKLFKEYVKAGFTREEALKIILARIQDDNWDLAPQLNEKEQINGNTSDGEPTI